LLTSPSSITAGGTINGWDSVAGPAFSAPPSMGVNQGAKQHNDGNTFADPGDFLFYGGTAYSSTPFVISPAYAVLRFTAPTTGLYDVSGSFSARSVDPRVPGSRITTADIFILHNNTELFSGFVNYGVGTSPNPIDVSLKAGDTIDFAVGINGTPNPASGNDTVGFRGSIVEPDPIVAPIPEPTTFGAMTIGLASLLAFARRRPYNPQSCRMLPLYSKHGTTATAMHSTRS
jgi:hypothetical protein